MAASMKNKPKAVTGKTGKKPEVVEKKAEKDLKKDGKKDQKRMGLKKKGTRGSKSESIKKYILRCTYGKKAKKDKEFKKNMKNMVVRTSLTYRKPKTKKLPKNPKCPRRVRSCFSKKLDKYGILKYPVTSEKAMKKIEEFNTLVFMCDRRAEKKTIKKAVKEMFNVDVMKINVLNKFGGDKKAYIRLGPKVDALDVANKIGIL